MGQLGFFLSILMYIGGVKNVWGNFKGFSGNFGN